MSVSLSANKALTEFWESAHKKYGADIRFGLSSADQERLLALEKQLEEAKESRRQNRHERSSFDPAAICSRRN